MLTTLRKTIGFTKTPMNPGDDGSAFLGFCSFASGDSGKSIRDEFTQGRDATGETTQQTAAAFFDWLIVNHWGEAVQPTHPGSTHG